MSLELPGSLARLLSLAPLVLAEIPQSTYYVSPNDFGIHLLWADQRNSRAPYFIYQSATCIKLFTGSVEWHPNRSMSRESKSRSNIRVCLYITENEKKRLSPDSSKLALLLEEVLFAVIIIDIASSSYTLHWAGHSFEQWWASGLASLDMTATRGRRRQ